MQKQCIKDDMYQISEEENRMKKQKVNKDDGAPSNINIARADAIMTTASVPQQSMDSTLEAHLDNARMCGVCHSVFSDPAILLPCSHKFCRACIMPSANDTKCPTCLQECCESEIIENEKVLQHVSRDNFGAVQLNYDGSLFDMLSPDILFQVFQWIGPDDMKTYIRLAISNDPVLTRFIYTECTYLWKHLDFAKFPGINDLQLQSLLERINAHSVTESITFDKKTCSPITGAGLEPLRNSQVLESIDLRQSDATEYGPTHLNDELVIDILSTMLPHKLRKVKLLKQDRSMPSPFSYDYHPWSFFFTSLQVKEAQVWQDKSCSHCHKALAPEECTLFAMNESLYCDACDKYSCRPWNSSSDCPSLQECPHCLDWFCSCREMTACNFCDKKCCSAACKDDLLLKCEECESKGETTISCYSCEVVRQCQECKRTCCGACMWPWTRMILPCDCCHDFFCSDCFAGDLCYVCNRRLCNKCCEMEVCHTGRHNVCRECCENGHNGKCAFLYCISTCSCCDPDIDDVCQKCDYCDMQICNDPECTSHDCRTPGELVYSARDAGEDDDVNNCCACGKKHLESPSGQQFICGWLQS